MTATADLARRLADMERRLAAMERATQLGNSSVTTSAGEVSVPDLLDRVDQASADAAQALLDVTDARAVADGKVTVYYDLTAPEGADYGDQWVAPADLYGGLAGAKILMVWDGDSWEVGDQTALDALVAAQNAQDTADLKIQTFYRVLPPDAVLDNLGSGDLWFDTSQGNRQSRWSGSAWVLLPLGQIETPDYSESNGGSRVDGDTVQFPNVNVIGEMGAGLVTTESLTLDGMDLATELIEPLPDGATAYRYSASGTHAGNFGATAVALFEFNIGSLVGGRLYQVHCTGHLQATDMDSAYDLYVTYTTDGSQPGTNSPTLDGSLTRVNVGSVSSSSFDVFAYFPPVADFETVKFVLCGRRASGSGAAFIFLTDPNRSFQWIVQDLGSYASARAGAVLSQRKKGGGPVEDPDPPAPDPDPVSRYRKVWPVTWSRSYDQNNGTRDGDDTADLYQGYVSGTHGRTKSLMGFDDSAIRAALAGATIKKVQLQFRVKHSYLNAGMTVYISAHDYSDKPGTWDGGRVDEAEATKGGCKAGSTYTVTLPNSIGTEFKSGATKGLGFGPGPNNSTTGYGYMYGNGSKYEPKLVIEYEK